ncbi:MAG TPA: HutD family protein [Steroidobacteraceae bacterium]|nr:HutD family protein [Steroidobacteraceae bacterium]
MLLLRESRYPVVPWRNGGGLTREMLRDPPEPLPFDWRLSLATIERSGPFSHFPGYQRTLVLVGGAGIELSFGAHGGLRLCEVGKSVTFDGAWATDCTLLDGPSTDLNLMVSQARAAASTRCVRLTGEETVPTAGWLETFICCLSGSLEIIDSAGRMQSVETLDVARCFERDGPVTCKPGMSGVAHAFFASVRRLAHAL